MTYHGLNLLMEKLKQLIYTNDNPLISNHPSMLSKRPQLQLLYEELGSMIQALSVENGTHIHKLEEVVNLKKRFKEVAEEARDMFDEFVYVINLKNKRPSQISNHLEMSLNIEDVMISIKSIKEDFISIVSLHNMKIGSSPKTDSLKMKNRSAAAAAAGGTSCSRKSLGSNTVWDEIVVGIDRDFNLIKGKLTEDTKKLDVVSIIGMGGSGKTTLARKLFNDPYVVHYFKLRGWVTVSQSYEKTDLLNQILASMGVELDLDKRNSYSHLCQKLHQHLMGRTYLVVIDDIWNTEAWDDLKLVFPDNNTRSRLLLTSRHKKVALHAKSQGLVHQLSCLTNEESWELLRKKLFHGNDLPDSLTVPGMRIARNCHGLPLAVVVMAGVLAKESVSKDSWERISRSGSSLIVSNNEKEHMETLALSFNHLPSHLRDCFLYLGGFPEDYRFGVKELILLWIAEGFIQEAENQTLEETAKDYLMELADRNLVVVHKRRFNGAIKTFSVHDVLRELCLEIATKERFCGNVVEYDDRIIAPYKRSRILIRHNNNLNLHFLYNNYISPVWYFINKFPHYYWRLLTVLDLKLRLPTYFAEEIALLISLRYLAIQDDHRNFQSTIFDLWNLQVLIIESNSSYHLKLPNTVSNLVNLRHLRCSRTIIFPQLQLPLMNLQTISNVVLGDGPKSWVNYFPFVKKLSCFSYRKYNFEALTCLETLKIRTMKSERICHKTLMKKISMRFPASLKKLTLKGCHLPWRCMSQIQSLPNLEVLKLLNNAFVGSLWDAGAEPFQQLKLLKFNGLDIKQWEASSINFPCLEKLDLVNCYQLERIPHEMSYIPTLEHIQINGCNSSVSLSAYEIQKEQHADGNYELKIRHDNFELMMSVHSSFLLTSMMSVHRSFQFILMYQNIFSERRNDELLRFLKNRRGTSINRLAPHELKILELPIDHPPVHNHIHRSRIWNDGRSNYRPIKRKMLKGSRRNRYIQY